MNRPGKDKKGRAPTGGGPGPWALKAALRHGQGGLGKDPEVDNKSQDEGDAAFAIHLSLSLLRIHGESNAEIGTYPNVRKGICQPQPDNEESLPAFVEIIEGETGVESGSAGKSPFVDIEAGMVMGPA